MCVSACTLTLTHTFSSITKFYYQALVWLLWKLNLELYTRPLSYIPSPVK